MYEGVYVAQEVTYTDVNQGRVANCIFLATLAAVAQYPRFTDDPNSIYGMINSVGPGQWTVRLHTPTGIQLVPVDTPVDRGLDMAQPTDFDNRGYAEIWPLLVEHAVDSVFQGYATNFPDGPSTWRYLTGDTSVTTGTLPGRGAGQSPREYFDQFVDDVLEPAFNAHDRVVLESNGNSDCIVSSHAYLVIGFDKVEGTITLYNPWGFDAGRASPIIQIDLTELENVGGYNWYPNPEIE